MSSEAADFKKSSRDADFSELEERDGSDVSSTEQAGSSGTPDEVTKLKAELRDTREKYLRALADFENYKKRALKERSELLKYQGDRIFFDMLEVLDNLELALNYKEADPNKLREGLELTHKLFLDILKKWDVRGESALGKDFNPATHQAISKLRVADTKPGTVINELKRAYLYKDKLLRPGDVVVASEDSEEQPKIEETGGSEKETEPN